MCRIFGIAYDSVDEPLTATEIAQIMYPALIHGGPHAWGFMQWDGYGDVDYFSAPGRCDTAEAEFLIEENINPQPVWMVGHVRYATHGKPEENINNHPIRHRHHIGVHNGVLRNHEDILSVTGRQDDSAVVDSEAIFAAVEKWGAKEGLAKIQGDMVTVFVDERRPDRLYMGRSHGRSIYFGFTINGNLIFASEMKALDAVESAGIKFVGDYSGMQENRLLMIMGGQIKERVTFSPVPPKTPVVIPTGPRPSHDWAQWHANQLAKRRGEKLFPKQGKKKGRKGTKVPVPENGITEIVTVDIEGPFPEATPSSLFYLDGELLTASEYQIAIENRD